MKVNETCVGCEECLPYCTQGAIFMSEDARACVDRDLCVECGVCIDSDICPVSAFEEDQDELATFKRPFGRLLAKHLDSKTVTKGSGYDVKTNDATGKIPTDKMVMRLELNRPRGGLKFGDIERMRVEMESLGWNPKVGSRARSIRGDGLSEKMADQRILTCHLEVILAPEKIPQIVKDATRFVNAHDLWVSINVAGVAEMIDRTQTVLKDAGVHMEPVAKVNLGLGRRK
jgi:NAD-dependent dihydropyrimidine dehydrogenase PreA subunit